MCSNRDIGPLRYQFTSRGIEIVQVGATPDGQGEEGQRNPAGCRPDQVLRRGVGGRDTDFKGRNLLRLHFFQRSNLPRSSWSLVLDVGHSGPVITPLQRDLSTAPRPIDHHLLALQKSGPQ